MSFDHNIYENIRTRAIVLLRDCVLTIPPNSNADNAAWTLPGGGLCPHESLAECVRRETLEETGIRVRVGRIAFLREWIVPRHASSTAPDPSGHGHGYGLEVSTMLRRRSRCCRHGRNSRVTAPPNGCR
jgi:8-oxo-dGTP pyrophosphatase MutT (NUDIX family)